MWVTFEIMQTLEKPLADCPRFHSVNHPLVRHKLSHLRDIRTRTPVFRQLVHELSLLLFYPATADLVLEPVSLRTPLEPMSGEQLRKEQPPVLVPILRAGLGMLTAFNEMLPQACVGHLGIRRDEKTLKPTVYYQNIPLGHPDRPFILLDPMLATGGSTSQAVTELKRQFPGQYRLVSILAAPEGVRRLAKDHPDLTIFCAGLDRQLNEKGYICPGLGDAGDRIFGTVV